MAWLNDNPPRRSQFRSPRRATPTGCCVVHTAENAMSTATPDRGAENVAQFIRTRTDAGSYHDLVDSDSAIQLVRYSDEAFQDGTGSNPWAYGLSFACRTIDWNRMTPARRTAFLRQGAAAAARWNDWLGRTHGRTTPARRITRAQSNAGQAGFIAHGERDPGRRSDPGTIPPNLFPWDEFLALYADAIDDGPRPDPSPSPDPGGFLMSLSAQQQQTVFAGSLAALQIQEEVVGTTDANGDTRQDRMVRIANETLTLARSTQAAVEDLSRRLAALEAK